ncbi:MAG TPA: hypothetical protein VN926_04095, partial [Bradyrhizobium sp.]|nr:hypothetical protein [Bradyrhizobium sp.]
MIVTHQGLKNFTQSRCNDSKPAKVMFKAGPYLRYRRGLSARTTVATAAPDHQHKPGASKRSKQRHSKEITDGFQ